jgi:hypothetical protein
MAHAAVNNCLENIVNALGNRGSDLSRSQCLMKHRREPNSLRKSFLGGGTIR